MASTSYRNNFISSGYAQKNVAIRPYDQPSVNQKFRASSAYDYDIGSALHTQAASGNILIETIKEQRRQRQKIKTRQR